MNLSFLILIFIISILINIYLTYLIAKRKKRDIINRQKNHLLEAEIQRKQPEKDCQICLGKISKIAVSTDNLRTFYTNLLSLVHEALNIEFSYIFTSIPEENNLTLVAGIGWQIGKIGTYKINYNNSLFKQILDQDQQIKISDNFDFTDWGKNLDSKINLDLLTQGINLLIKHPFNPKKINIYGFYTARENQFSQLEIDFFSQLKEIIENQLILHTKNQQFRFLQRAINSSTNGIVITSSQKHKPIIYVNRGFEKITGYSSQEVMGKSCRFLQGKETNQEGIEKIRLALDNQTEIRTVVKNFRKNGEAFWNEIYISPVYDDDNNLTNFIGVQNDITNKYKIEQDLANKTQQLETFSDKLQQINNLKQVNFNSNQEIFDYYIQKICHILNMQVGLISELIGVTFITVSSYCSNENQLLFTDENHNNIITKLSQEVATQKESFVSDNLKTSEYYKNESFISQLNLVYYLATPIIINKEIYGIIHLFSQEKNNLHYSYQKDLIEAIAQTMSKIIVANEAELEKEQFNIALRESQNKLDSIFSSLEDVIWSIHPQTLQLTYISQSAENLYQCKLAEFYEEKCFWLNFVDLKQRQYIRGLYADILNISLLNQEIKTHDLEYKIILKNGDKKYVRDRAYVIYDNEENRIRIDGIITDITKNKITQLALEKSEQEFRILFESASIGMLITDIQGTILQANNSLSQLLGYEKSELINYPEQIIHHPEDWAKNQLFYDSIITENIENNSQTTRYLTKNKTIISAINHITVLRNNRGKITQLIQQIVDVSQIKVMEEQILYNAHYDKLTGLANHFLFVDRLKQTLKRCQKYHQLFAVLVIDLDNFKHINDSMGHNIGDKLLCIIAEKIIKCINYQDTVARLNSDQFCVLLENLKSEEEAIIIANKILNSCHNNNNINEYQFFSSVSIGITYSLIGYKKPEEMIRDADLTMHKAKQDGKNCYRIFNPQMHTQLLEKIKLENCLRKAVNDLEFELYYQPIINLQTKIIAGFEALIRWNSPDLGFVSPAKFIPLAEETNLIIPLGNWILETAIKQLGKWQKKYPQLSPTIAVNLSSKQLLDPNLLTTIDSLVREYDINPQLLKMEITESILMENFSESEEILHQFQTRKFKISLDDFGTGYSSLSYLHQLPFNTLKIDRSFIISIEKKQELNSIIETIITLAHNLGLDVVAEGIEEPIQEEMLSKLNCDYVQGYMYSKPLNAQKAEEFIEQFVASS